MLRQHGVFSCDLSLFDIAICLINFMIIFYWVLANVNWLENCFLQLPSVVSCTVHQLFLVSCSLDSWKGAFLCMLAVMMSWRVSAYVWPKQWESCKILSTLSSMDSKYCLESYSFIHIVHGSIFHSLTLFICNFVLEFKLFCIYFTDIYFPFFCEWSSEEL